MVSYFLDFWPEWSQLDRVNGEYVLTHDRMEYEEKPPASCFLADPESSNRETNQIESMDEVVEKMVSKIHPNPANEFLEIRSKSLILSLSVFSQTGKKMLNETNINTENHTFTELNKFPAGSYIIEVVTEKQTDYHQFIKQ